MLEKLGKGLRSALDKVTKAGYVDSATIDSLAEEIRKTLIAGDVDVALAGKLSEAIKQRAGKEKPPAGLSAKEHVVRIVYEELVKFVGRKPEVNLKPRKLLVVGLFGSGKCLHPTTFLPLADGTTITIEELYKIYDSKEEKDGEDFVVPLDEGDLNIFSMNEELKISPSSAAALWKLKSPSELIKVELYNGLDHMLITTPEHPFFVLNSSNILQIRADELSPGMQVAVPNSLHIEGASTDLLEYLLSRPECWIICNKEIAAKTKIATRRIYGTMENACSSLKIGLNYCSLTDNMKNRGETPLKLVAAVCPAILKDSYLKVRWVNYPERSTRKHFIIPRYLTPELAEWLGHIIGDGNIHKTSVNFHNTSKELLERFRYLSVLLFGIEPISITRRGVTRLTISSRALISYLNQIFCLKPGEKSSTATVPALIERSPSPVISSFLRAFIDCEGYIEEKSRHAEIASASNKMIKQLGMLFLRLGILTSYSKKNVKGRPYYRLFIHGRYLEKLAVAIQPIIPYKQAALQNSIKIGKWQGPGSQEMFYLGPMLRQIRESYGVTIGEIQKYINSYGLYEKKGRISRDSLRLYIAALEKCRSWLPLLQAISDGKISYKNLLQIIGSRGRLNPTLTRLAEIGYVTTSGSNYMITKAGVDLLINSEQLRSVLKWLKSIAEAEISWLEIRNVTKVPSDVPYVYDITVPRYHNFVAGATIVHNTTSLGKLAKFYQKKGLKVGLIGCDVHRPAAMDQIQQVAKQCAVPVYAPKGQKDPLAIARAGIEQLSGRADLLLFDSSGRSSLDKELAEELKSLGKAIEPDEVLLVIPADLGQAAREQAEGFSKLVGITGVFITKMDGTAKAGGALTACSVSGAPVKFIGIGEKLDAIEVFDPERFVSRLLGYADLQGLLEKAKEAIPEEKAKELTERLMEGKFTLNDFYEQIKAVGKMGGLGDMLGSAMPIPKGVDLDQQEKKMKKWGFAIQSMTAKEKAEPNLLNESRVRRISKGSGVSESEIKEMLKAYEQARKVSKLISAGGMKRGMLAQIAKRFKGLG